MAAPEDQETILIHERTLNVDEAINVLENSVADLYSDDSELAKTPPSSSTLNSKIEKYSSSSSSLQTTPNIEMSPFSTSPHEAPVSPLAERISSTDSYGSVVSHLERDSSNAELTSVGSEVLVQLEDVTTPQNSPEAVVKTSVPTFSIASPMRIIAETKDQNLNSVTFSIKKKCSCTKSQCIKMYCTCFARGHFCLNCGCTNCHNTLDHSIERGNAIRQVLGKNNNAFKPKIIKTTPSNSGDDDVFITPDTPKVSIEKSEKIHKSGCRCTRSNCLKRYCECFDANIGCTSKCRCISCENTEARRNVVFAKYALDSNVENRTAFESGKEIPVWLFLKDNVIEAFTQVLCSKANELEGSGVTDEATIIAALIHEFGNCFGMILNEN